MGYPDTSRIGTSVEVQVYDFTTSLVFSVRLRLCSFNSVLIFIKKEERFVPNPYESEKGNIDEKTKCICIKPNTTL